MRPGSPHANDRNDPSDRKDPSDRQNQKDRQGGRSDPPPPASADPTVSAEGSPTPATDPRRARVDALLRDLGSNLDRASSCIAEAPPSCPTGLPAIDALLGGGIPRGRLCELNGPPSSGLTSLALSLLATTTRAGHCVGLVDRVDAFDPSSAERAGVVLERVLWVRPQAFEEARRCVERLLETDGFPLVVLDLACPVRGDASAGPMRTVRSHRGCGKDAQGADDPTRRLREEQDTQTWLRLARLAAGTQGALVVIAHERTSGSSAHIAVEMQPGRACFSQAPALLEEIEAEAVLVRHRAAPVGLRTPLGGRGSTAA